MPFAILHVSDIHRSPTDPIGNDELISTLVADRDAYRTESPRVPAPDAIVVSGDLVYGARLGDRDFERTLRDQYDDALEFLDRLAQRFVDGDRSRVVLVPGNHDVDWNTAFTAMRRPEEGEVPAQLSQRAFAPPSS